MFTKKELNKIKKALPPNGFQLVADELGNTSADAVRMVLTEPDRYRIDVFDAVKVVIKRYKDRVETQKTEVLDVIS